MNILTLLKSTLHDNKVRSNYEKVEKAIRTKAKLVSDLEYHRTMSNFYTERVLEIDHNTDWWSYAEAKQKQHDHQMDFVHVEKRIAEAEAKVIAHTNAFKAAQKVRDEAASSD